MQAIGGNFYGTTSDGGTNGGYGTVFKVAADGTISSLLSFGRTNGANPYYATLVQDTDGSFYGTTYSGGVSNYGTVFRLSITPSPPAFQSVTHAGNTISFTWSALLGRSYQVQFTTNLTQTNWRALALPIAATNAIATASDTIGADRQRFYRVVLLP